jgi:uncharacterized membrane protein YGL010W
MIQHIRAAYMWELNHYLRYHRSFINLLLHTVLVPLEWLCFLTFTGTLVGPGPVFYVEVLLFCYYLTIHYNLPKGMSLILGGWMHLFLGCIAGHILTANWHVDSLRILIVVVFVLGWVIQVCVGHWLIEQNSPSMSDKLTMNSVALSVGLALADVDLPLHVSERSR